jgi:hypothetical protein
MKHEVYIAKVHAHNKVLARITEDALAANTDEEKAIVRATFESFQKEARTQRYGIYRDYYLLGYGTWFEMLYDGFLAFGNLYKRFCMLMNR